MTKLEAAREMGEEQIIREARLFGNGAHVFVPKGWAGNEIFLVRKAESLRERVLKVLGPYLDKIVGVYLYGSRARGEALQDSDIDLLIISNESFKIKEKGFDILVLRNEEIDKRIKNEPILFKGIINEAEPIINSMLLNKLKIKYKIKKADVNSYKIDTKKLIEKNRELLDLDEKADDYASNETIYSIILRLRGIFIIESMLKEESYSNRGFEKWALENGINKQDFDLLYEIYRDVKSNRKVRNKIKTESVRKILDLLILEVNKL